MKTKQLELPLDHNPSLNHMATLWATDEIKNGEGTNWDYEYEMAWNMIENQLEEKNRGGIQYNE